jgi:hypothetical protein
MTVAAGFVGKQFVAMIAKGFFLAKDNHRIAAKMLRRRGGHPDGAVGWRGLQGVGGPGRADLISWSRRKHI